MEHLWGEVKRRLYSQSEKSRSKKKLWDKLQDVWNDIERNICTNLINSMPALIQAVLDAEGGYTRY